MPDTLHNVLPVLISILLIITIAVLQAYSKTAAAITATMPLTIPLALWIVYADNKNDRTEIVRFSESLFVGVGATMVFTVAIWVASRAGLGLVATLAVGYVAWAGVLGVHYALRALL